MGGYRYMGDKLYAQQSSSLAGGKRCKNKISKFAFIQTLKGERIGYRSRRFCVSLSFLKNYKDIKKKNFLLVINYCEHVFELDILRKKLDSVYLCEGVEEAVTITQRCVKRAL
ncbi:hypothetical protein POVWA2_037090 [Plasmodium ovale wallikeri]|uniref:Uncharacterized protein n=1 Tax=Plasmodium ovale wallikeri TaxID=864142 RepID=A0A1A8Z3X7_PLAOA|nr:hypothetical protein POVWA1_038120 [Plasmodium ovale wallikeri]SBT39103.1 hypothetical protein POVWA2_037090 [Plasmodium ovale wallikeri]